MGFKESRIKAKTAYFLITDTNIYRTDQILEQVDEWVHAFITGRMVQAPFTDECDMAEFEAHLQATVNETQKLIREESDEF